MKRKVAWRVTIHTIRDKSEKKNLITKQTMRNEEKLQTFIYQIPLKYKSLFKQNTILTDIMFFLLVFGSKKRIFLSFFSYYEGIMSSPSQARLVDRQICFLKKTRQWTWDVHLTLDTLWLRLVQTRRLTSPYCLNQSFSTSTTRVYILTSLSFI